MTHPKEMHLVRIGKRVISLRHLILVDHIDGDGDPTGPIIGGARVVLESGVAFDLGPVDTETLDRHLTVVVVPDPAEVVTESGVVAARVDLRSGLVIPARQEGGESG